MAATEAEDPDEILGLALREVCGLTTWPVGHVYLWNEQRDLLLPSAIWHLDDPERFRSFREATEEHSFAPGRGLPGRVAADGEPHWITEVTADSNFPRAPDAEAVGIGAGFAFPVTTSSGVAAVLEFYSTETLEPDEPLLAMLATVGSNLGRVFERVEATAAVREREEAFRALVRSASDAIVTIDVNSTIVFANAAVREILGYDPEKLRGQAFTKLMPQRFRQRHRDGIARYIESGERTIAWDGVELPGLHRDGREIPLEISFGDFTREGTHFFTGIMRDISDRKRSEAAQERARESRRRLVRGFAHDLKNPLGAVEGSLALLSEELTAELSPVQRAHVERARRSLGNALELIERLLDMVRAETGELELHWQTTDVGSALTDVAEEFQVRAREKELSLSVERAKDLPPTRSDPVRVRQVIRNLVSNAVKYTPVGGCVEISASVTEAKPRAGAGPRIVITVSDTGPGVSPADRHLLFEEFSRLRSDETEGMGIGLAISRQIAHALGGGLALAEEQEEGAAFSFWLPVEGGEGS